MLAEIEDAMIERCKRVLGKHVKAVEDLPNGWTEQSLEAAFRNVPGVYVAWSGGQGGQSKSALLNGRYAVYFVTGHASGERARRRGEKGAVGAYELIELVVPALHGLSIDDVGTLRLERVDNLNSDFFDKKGVAVYGAVYALDKMPFKAPLDGSALADFAIFHANHQVPDGPDTETHQTLPTGSEVTP